MDAEGLALQVRSGGEVDVRNNRAARPKARPAPPAATAIRDLRRDWRRWNAAERLCALAFCGLWGAGVITAALADGHSLSSATITRAAHAILQATSATERAALQISGYPS